VKSTGITPASARFRSSPNPTLIQCIDVQHEVPITSINKPAAPVGERASSKTRAGRPSRRRPRPSSSWTALDV
jgi:hypothetical protein